MKRTRVMIGLASLVGAALIASPAVALNAFSPTGHLNVRSGPGFQYPVVGVMQQNVLQSPGASRIIPGAALPWAR
jgi:uncharacterized protein YraI